MTRASLRHTMNHSDLLNLFRSSHQRCSVKRAVLKNFAIFTGKHRCRSCFLLKVKACNFIRKRLRHRCFSVNIVKFLRTSTSKKTREQLLLKILQHWCFPMKFAEFIRKPVSKNICERLLLFVLHQNTITLRDGEFGLDETSIECILFNQMMQLYNFYVS